MQIADGPHAKPRGLGMRAKDICGAPTLTTHADHTTTTRIHVHTTNKHKTNVCTCTCVHTQTHPPTLPPPHTHLDLWHLLVVHSSSFSLRRTEVPTTTSITPLAPISTIPWGVEESEGTNSLTLKSCYSRCLYLGQAAGLTCQKHLQQPTKGRGMPYIHFWS